VFLPRRFPIAATLIIAQAAWALGEGEDGPLRIREVWVPHDEFFELAKDRPDGVVMTLEEYRTLVLAGLARPRTAPPTLPPLQSAVVFAEHRGRAEGRSVRFHSKLTVRVLRDGWVRCPLSPVPESLGRITVDEQPGWLVRDKSGSFLLLRGKGEHDVELVFSHAATETDDRWKIEGTVPGAQTSRIVLDVQGQAEASSTPGFLLSEPVPSGTRFTVQLGTGSDFEISWRRQRSLGENDALLAATHGLTVLPRREDPLFDWNADITVSRRKTDVLEFTEAAGTRVVEVRGDHVHSWQRVADKLIVRLDAPVTGSFRLAFSGILVGDRVDEDGEPARRFDVGVPVLLGAAANSGYLGVRDPSPQRLEVEEPSGLTEVSRRDAGPLLGSSDVAHAFSFADGTARVRLTAHPRAGAFESRTACLVRVLESSVNLDAVYRVRVRHGRLYSLRLPLPGYWRLASLEPLGNSPGAAVPIRHEIVGEGDSQAIEMEIARAISPTRPLSFRLRLEHRSFEPDITWEERSLEFSVPKLAADRSRVDVAVALAGSMVADFPEQSSWSTLSREELLAVGLADEDLVAGLTATSTSASTTLPPITLTLRHRRPHGEYQAVTHLLALEGRLRVRTDVRLAVVDRAVDTLRVRLPVDRDVNVLIPGDGIQEITDGDGDGDGDSVRSVRYARPWTGTREFRVEYEVSGGSRRVPWIEIDDGTPEATLDTFHGEHSVVFQSFGPVKVEVEPGDELAAVDIDELPGVGRPWDEGRALFGYRFRAASGTALPDGKNVSTFRVVEFSRAEAVDIIVRDLDLTTVLDPSGVSRTRVDLLLAYGKGWQQLVVTLDPRSQLKFVTVDERPELRVRKGDEPGRWLIPLPPRSYARLAIIYERSGAGSSTLGPWGAWVEEGPRFEGVPVVESRWKLLHPPGYRFFVEEGNLQAVAPDAETRERSFLEALFSRISHGDWPLTRTWTDDGEGRPRVAPDPLPSTAAANAAGVAGRPSDELLPLTPQQASQLSTLEEQRAGPDLLIGLAPSGHLIETRKLSGEPVLELSYRRLGWWRFSTSAVFLVTLVAGLWFALSRGRRRFWRTTVATLVGVALLSDVAGWLVGWESPFLWIPFCEALLLLLVLGAVYEVAKVTAAFVRRRRALRTAALASLVIASLLTPTLTPHATADQTPADRTPVDEAVISYDPELFPSISSDDTKVYLSHETFRKLRALANPRTTQEDPEPPADHVLGNAMYSLRTQGDSYSLVGEIDLGVLTDGWIALPLPFDRSQVTRITVDGEEIGVAQKDGRPILGIKGEGVRKLKIELEGAVIRRPGVYRVVSTLLGADAVHVHARLPRGAKPSAPRSTGGIRSQATEDGVTVDLNIGRGKLVDLSWSFPSQKGEQSTRVESSSYSDLLLTLDGYLVEREESVRVTGSPADVLEYEILGDWRVREVRANEMTEWTVTGDQDSRRLQVFFSRPIESARLQISGWAPLADTAVDDGGRPVASLALDGAVRQESFLGVRHDARRRWGTDILDAGQRASGAALGAAFRIAKERPADRIYHFHDAASDGVVSAIALSGVVDLTTNATLLLTEHTTTVSARVRYRASGLGTLRQEVVLPTGWEFRGAEGDTVHDWETREDVNGTRLVVHLTTRAATGTEVRWAAQRRHESLSSPVAVPVLTTTTDPAARSESLTWAIATSDGLDVRMADGSTGVETTPRDDLREWVRVPPGSRYVFDLRTTGSRPDYSLSLDVNTPQSKVSALAVLFARAAEDFVLVNSQIDFRVEGGVSDRFRFRLPTGANDVRLQTRNQKSLTAPEPDVHEVEMISGVTGEHSVLLSYRLPREQDAGVTLRPFEIFAGNTRIDDIEHWVGVVETEEALTRPLPDGLEEVEVSSLPYLPDGVATDSLRHTFRATKPGWTLELESEELEMVAGAAAQIDLVDIVTIVGVDGTVRTETSYIVRNRELQFLRVRLPPEAKLWRATLDDATVVVSKAGDILQIPLRHLGDADLDLVVNLSYEQPKVDMPSLWTSLVLAAPELVDLDRNDSNASISVTRTLWRVELPDGYSASLSGGNMHEVVSSVEYASKVESNIEAVKRLTGLLEADAATPRAGGRRKRMNRRQRNVLQSNLKELQMQLDDNVQQLGAKVLDLRGPGDDPIQSAREPRIEGVQVREQQEESLERLAEARDYQQILQKAIRANDRQAADTRSASEQAFEDQYNFLGNDWVDNRVRQAREDPPRSADKVDLDRLVDGAPPPGLSVSGKGRPRETRIDSAEARTVQSGGLEPIDGPTARTISPALETPSTPRGSGGLSFRANGGKVDLELRIRKEGVAPHVGSLLAIVAILAMIGLRAWRTRR